MTTSRPDDLVELEIPARTRSLGDFDVGRVLPSPVRRTVGPFIFFDHMGPAHLDPGRGMDVRPHPHINLATVTYLFEGEIFHRDSLGSAQAIRPGAINWMTAGRGIVHSERSPAEARAAGPVLHGLQLWVALPQSSEECEPAFAHHPASTIPALDDPGVKLRVLAGEAHGARSPVDVASPLFYVEALLDPGAKLELPREYEERAVYVVSGAVEVGGRTLGPRNMLVFRSGTDPVLTATEPTRLVTLGGAPIGPRYIFWNFVSSSQERIVEAARAWKAEQFPLVPGDEHERIPLTEEPRFPAA
jgi:redox-sensitive bicupin YhaK (pirin superfamily)